jgi:enterochelin esterase-like enzyme
MKLSLPKVGRPGLGLPKFARPHLARPHLPNDPAALIGRARPGARFERFAWLPAGAVAAAVVVLGSVYSDTVRSTDVTFVLMGFDPDRAQLITALIIGGVAAAVATLLVNRVGYGTVLGACSVAALFTETFVAETRNALAATGALGRFDRTGWALTFVTLFVIGFIAAWAGATLAAGARPAIIASGVATRDLAKTRRPGLARRPIAAVLVIVLLGVTVPAFGDMVNLSPDALMLGGGNQGGGLVHDVSLPPIVSAASASATPGATPSTESSASASVGASPSPTPTPRITAQPGTKPWLAWKPSGSGKAVEVDLPAPWVGGSKSEIDIYTPPGYDPEQDRTYPVIYEAPTGLSLWDKGTGVLAALDTLIDSGEIPATIVVFIDSLGPPYGDTECADSFDGKQWFETYISKTVVEFVDTHFRTIQDPAARAIMGMSAGGFCAPMLALRHPDVFRISISFSGYFWAGASGGDSALPFGPDGLNSHSAAWLAPNLQGYVRYQMYFILVAADNGDFYGVSAKNFEDTLRINGYKYYALASQYTHGWPQVRYDTPAVLDAWAAQLVINGIW